MRFWDSSGIVAVVAREIELPQCLALLQTDDEMAVWCWTSVELLSALHRKRRGGDLTAAGWALAAQQVSLRRLNNLVWLSVAPERGPVSLPRLAAAAEAAPPAPTALETPWSASRPTGRLGILPWR